MDVNQAPLESETTSRCAVMILGMHRSGTSALAGLLTRLGGDGPVNPLGGSPNNPLGHFETKPLFHLQEELLTSAGTSWDDYGAFPENWLTSMKAQEFADRLKNLLQTEFGASRFFVVKDPRNCRLMPFWHEVLIGMQIKPLFVHTHRNPAEVAQSLHKRNGFDPAYGYLLWLRHVLDAEAGSRGRTRSFTSYDRLLKSWPTEIEKIAVDLDISWPKYSGSQLSQIGEMIRPDLRHNTSDGLIHSKVFSSWYRDAFDVFDRWAEHGEVAEDYKILDDIRQEFNKSAIAFAGTVYAKGNKHAHEQNTTLNALKSEHARIAEELKSTRTAFDQSKSALDSTHEALHATNAKLTKEQSQRADLASVLASTQTKVQTLQAAGLKREEVVQDLGTRVAQLDEKNQMLKRSSSWRITAPIRRIAKLMR